MKYKASVTIANINPGKIWQLLTIECQFKNFNFIEEKKSIMLYAYKENEMAWKHRENIVYYLYVEKCFLILLMYMVT